jgi:hypothetical protein
MADSQGFTGRYATDIERTPGLLYAAVGVVLSTHEDRSVPESAIAPAVNHSVRTRWLMPPTWPPRSEVFLDAEAKVRWFASYVAALDAEKAAATDLAELASRTAG